MSFVSAVYGQLPVRPTTSFHHSSSSAGELLFFARRRAARVKRRKGRIFREYRLLSPISNLSTSSSRISREKQRCNRERSTINDGCGWGWEVRLMALWLMSRRRVGNLNMPANGLRAVTGGYGSAVISVNWFVCVDISISIQKLIFTKLSHFEWSYNYLILIGLG